MMRLLSLCTCWTTTPSTLIKHRSVITVTMRWMVAYTVMVRKKMRLRRGCSSKRKQKCVQDRRTTRNWKIKSWSRLGNRCLLMRAPALTKPPSGWQSIEDQFFRMMAKYPNRTPRTFRSLQGRWDVIKPICSRWAACWEQVRNAPPSGTVESDYASFFHVPSCANHL